MLHYFGPKWGNRGLYLSAIALISLMLPQAALAQDRPKPIKCGNSGKILLALAGVAVGVIADRVLKIKGGNAVILPILGGLGGLVIGKEIDDRGCRLKRLAKANKLDMSIDTIPAVIETDAEENSGKSNAPAAGLSVSVRDNGRQFATDSDQLDPAAAAYFGQIADMYSYDRQMKELPANATDDQKQLVGTLRDKVIILIGHTDDTGEAKANAALSERRARTVAALFAAHGVPMDHIYYQGAGESLPIADNNTDDGRARNRRVEIVDLPGKEALTAYLRTRAADPSRYRPIPATLPTGQAAGAEGNAPAPSLRSNPGHVPKKPLQTPTPTPTPTRTSGGAITHPAKKPARPTAAPTPTPPSQVTATITKPALPPKKVTPSPFEINFGGTTAGFLVPDIGPATTSEHGGKARNASVATCDVDRPHISYAVRSLAPSSHLQYGTADYLPGLYGTSWFGTVNGQLVSLTHVTVLRDGGMPVSPPQLLVYRDWNPKKGTKARATFIRQPEVNVYRGRKGLLYRVFASGAGNLRCIDVLIAPDGGAIAPSSQLYYHYTGELRRANYPARVAR